MLGGKCHPSVPRKAMETAVRSKARAAILSTRSLEEAALCDRVAVLVAGQLRWVSV